MISHPLRARSFDPQRTISRHKLAERMKIHRGSETKSTPTRSRPRIYIMGIAKQQLPSGLATSVSLIRGHPERRDALPQTGKGSQIDTLSVTGQLRPREILLVVHEDRGLVPRPHDARQNQIITLLTVDAIRLRPVDGALDLLTRTDSILMSDIIARKGGGCHLLEDLDHGLRPVDGPQDPIEMLRTNDAILRQLLGGIAHHPLSPDLHPGRNSPDDDLEEATTSVSSQLRGAKRKSKSGSNKRETCKSSRSAAFSTCQTTFTTRGRNGSRNGAGTGGEMSPKSKDSVPSTTGSKAA